MTEEGTTMTLESMKSTFLVETENKSVLWNNIYKSTFKCVLDNAVISMQYKILFNIICKKEYLFRVKISNNSTCNLC